MGFLLGFEVQGLGFIGFRVWGPQPITSFKKKYGMAGSFGPLDEGFHV